MGNIIGEPINGEILKQVKNRQKLQGAGYNSESVKRDPEVLNYLNNKWTRSNKRSLRLFQSIILTKIHRKAK